MKKFSIVACLVAIFALTGCGKGNQVVCTMSQDTSGMSMKQTVKLDIKSDKVEAASVDMDVTLDDAYKSYKSMLISSVKSEFASLESEFNTKINVKETSNGFKVSFKLTKAALESEFGSEATGTKAEAIKSFEAAGYTCK